ncbi:unnamed protein product, partial [Discosporangium mesarthrocarpum]
MANAAGTPTSPLDPAVDLHFSPIPTRFLSEGSPVGSDGTEFFDAHQEMPITPPVDPGNLHQHRISEGVNSGLNPGDMGDSNLDPDEAHDANNCCASDLSPRGQAWQHYNDADISISARALFASRDDQLKRERIRSGMMPNNGTPAEPGPSRDGRSMGSPPPPASHGGSSRFLSSFLRRGSRGLRGGKDAEETITTSVEGTGNRPLGAYVGGGLDAGDYPRDVRDDTSTQTETAEMGDGDSTVSDSLSAVDDTEVEEAEEEVEAEG